MFTDEENTRIFCIPIIFTCCVYSFSIIAVNGKGYFGIEGFYTCLEKCTECELLGLHFSCKETASESLCHANFKEIGVSDLYENVTCQKRQHPYRCCVKCTGTNIRICSACSAVYSRCLKCSVGKYDISSDCDKTCGNCLPDTEGKLTCDSYNGACYGKCGIGYFGDKCERICSRTCKIGACDQLSGHCDNGCVLGWHGIFCQIPCPDNCLKRSCTNHSGICDTGCVPGYHGDFCEKICSDSCMSGVCDSQTALCVHGCRTGFEGIFCNKTSKVYTFHDIVLVTGTTAGSVSAIIICVCFCFIRKNFLKRKSQSLPESSQMTQTEQPTNNDIYDEISDTQGNTFQGLTHTELDTRYSKKCSSFSIENGEHMTDDRLISPARTKFPEMSPAIPSSAIERQSQITKNTSCVSYEIPNTCFQSGADSNFDTKENENCVIYSIESDNIVQTRQNTADNQVNHENWQYIHPVT